MKVLIAPDSFGGTLTAAAAADAIAAGWRGARPDDELVPIPMSDGGEGLLAVIARTTPATWHEAEVAGPLGHPQQAHWLLCEDGTAVIESAQACGLAHLAPSERNPLQTTTYGVGQLLDAARRAGARRILVGLGGSATVDGGAGALTALGFRLTVPDGSGLKIGGGELHLVRHVERGWLDEAWQGVAVDQLADVRTVLGDAAVSYAPQKGATPEMVAHLGKALAIWAEVAERDLRCVGASSEHGSGAAGGLGFGLRVGLNAALVNGAARVADAVGLSAAVGDADIVITGEGRLDDTSLAGKVVGTVIDLAARRGTRPLAVVGAARTRPGGLARVVEAGPGGPGDDPAADVAAAAYRLAGEI